MTKKEAISILEDLKRSEDISTDVKEAINKAIAALQKPRTRTKTKVIREKSAADYNLSQKEWDSWAGFEI